MARQTFAVDEYTRVVTAKGSDWVDHTYQDALGNARALSRAKTIKEFEDVWKDLKATRVVTSPEEAVTDAQVEDFKPKFYLEWLEIRRPQDCRIHAGYVNKSTGYPSVSVRLGSGAKDSSKCLALHQVPARIRERVPHQPIPNWKDDDSVASHPCHVKACLTCAVRESRPTNNHRNYCRCCVIVNFKLVRICHHDPPCRQPGTKAFR
jgi:hypothetical protein